MLLLVGALMSSQMSYAAIRPADLDGMSMAELEELKREVDARLEQLQADEDAETADAQKKDASEKESQKKEETEKGAQKKEAQEKDTQKSNAQENDASEEDTQSQDTPDSAEAEPAEMDMATLEAELSKQPVVVADVIIDSARDWGYNSNDNFIQPVVVNNSEKDIKLLQVYIVGWDENNHPVFLHSEIQAVPSAYCVSMYMDNLAAGKLINDDLDANYQVFSADPECNVKKAMAIVGEYTTADDETWTNPLLEQWRAVYEGKDLTEPVIYTDRETIKKVQTALNAAGFNCGTPDGIAGAKTYAALNAYQEANGLAVSDLITDSLLRRMGI